ncbi:MAG: hypothetical protein IJ305_04760 [Oscillospiraceae bacterium]|nr:hypothetical protein [Oscillospiraceae bacterium]
MSEDMNKFFDNLEFVAELLGQAVEKGEPLPKEAVEKVSAFNESIQKLEERSVTLRKLNA